MGGRLAGAATAQPDDGVRGEGALWPHAEVVAQARAHLRPQGQRHFPLGRVSHQDEPGVYMCMYSMCAGLEKSFLFRVLSSY